MTWKKPIPETFWKQPWETYLIGGDFSRVLETGEEIVALTSDIVAVDKDGTDVSSTVLDNSYKTVSTADADDIDVTPVTNGMLMTRVQAGTEDAMPYKITFKGVTNADNQFETDVTMKIKDA